MIACFQIPQIGIACERSRNTSLWSSPLALANDAGVLMAVSEDGAAYGVRPFQGASGARALCPELVVLDYDLPAYENAARAIWNLYAIESSIVEPKTPETCFIELTGSDLLMRVERLASLVRHAARASVQVGLARTKLVALRAAQAGKGHSVNRVPVDEEAAFLSTMPVAQVTSIDPKTCERLEKLGIRTLGEIRRAPIHRLTKSLRQTAVALERMANGEDSEPVKALWPPRTILEKFSFDDEISQEPILMHTLEHLAGKICARLRTTHEYCRELRLAVCLGDGCRISQAERLGFPICDAEAITRCAHRLLGRIGITQPVTGLILESADIGAVSGLQLKLMDTLGTGEGYPHERERSLAAAIDFLRLRWGNTAILHAQTIATIRQVRYLTYSLGRLLDEQVEVFTSESGQPVGFIRCERRYDIVRIQNRWREREWFWGSNCERSVYRVETTAGGVCELQNTGASWRLTARSD